MKKNNSPLETFLSRLGMKRKKKMKQYRNYTILVNSFEKKVYSQ
jgi:hypothetical protein